VSRRGRIDEGKTLMTEAPRVADAQTAVRVTTEWDAALYFKFGAERAQPALDLLARIDFAPRRIVDLGCGPGAGTRMLLERFPQAEILAVGNSEPMLAYARRSLPDMTFERTDIAKWRPRQPPDLIFANSSLQWLRNHETLFPRLMSYLAEGGALAVQMSDNLHEPSHSLMRMIAADGPWTRRLAPIAETRAVIGTHIDYYNWLKPLSDRLDIWETTYVHPLSGVDEVVDWFRSGALRPFLDPLDPSEQAQFLARYKRDLADAYDADSDGSLLFLYPRLFIHARKGGAKT
jgi:trans-aconitate 2-methyltransferase